MNPAAADFLERLGRVRPRLAGLAATDAPGSEALTDPDRKTGERWEWGQAWAHVAEFPAYWVRQIRALLAAPSPEPVAFGRVSSDPGRVGAIEAYRRTPALELWARIQPDLDELDALLRGLTDDEWAHAAGLHSTLGVMDLPRIVDEFLVGHLESHAGQLESLVPDPGA